MTTREEIEKQLTAARWAISARLDDALSRRDEANAEIKVLNAELDALPKLAVKRTRRAKAISDRAIESTPNGPVET
jgi:hypothetical protein